MEDPEDERVWIAAYLRGLRGLRVEGLGRRADGSEPSLPANRGGLLGRDGPTGLAGRLSHHWAVVCPRAIRGNRHLRDAKGGGRRGGGPDRRGAVGERSADGSESRPYPRIAGGWLMAERAVCRLPASRPVGRSERIQKGSKKDLKRMSEGSAEDLRGRSAAFRRVAGGAGRETPGPTSRSREQRLVAGMGGNEGGERKIGVGRRCSSGL